MEFKVRDELMNDDDLNDVSDREGGGGGGVQETDGGAGGGGVEGGGLQEPSAMGVWRDEVKGSRPTCDVGVSLTTDLFAYCQLHLDCPSKLRPSRHKPVRTPVQRSV